MQIIGLTGGIGSGKSTACKLLREIDPTLVIIDADLLSHEATKPGRIPFLLLKYLILPRDCFNPSSGELIRSRLAELIFAPNKKGRALKKIVERCIHPWIIWKMCLGIIWNWLRGEGRIVLDIPLLFEAKLQWMCTRTLLIDTTDPKLQFDRILKRNPQMSEEDARNRIAAQFSMEKKRKLADCSINTFSPTFHHAPVQTLMKSRVSKPTSKAILSKKQANIPNNKTKQQHQKKKIDLNSLDASFSELQRTKMSKSAAEARKSSKIAQVKPKISVPSRETVTKTSEDLAQLLKDF